ncbi:MAG TPA: SpvB/TcaC N-terminal domain-containing protein [Luteibacter sp.]|nr:SpvB/TcaC N-terminal domain-containing protein [Luteibacter sp.]
MEVTPPSLPKGGGAIQSIGHGWGAVGTSGASSLGIPLPISPGRGFAPALALSYSSLGGRTDFGQGWSLSLPAISVRSSHGVPQYGKDAQGRAIAQEYVTPDGDLLLLELDAAGNPVGRETRTFRGMDLGGDYHVDRYVARVAGSGTRYERWVGGIDDDTAFWLVHAGDGTLHLYGRTSRTEHVHVEGGSQVRWVAEWLLEESVAANGEHVYYEYQAEDGAGLDDDALPSGWRNRDRQCRRYLRRVRFGNHAPVSDNDAKAVLVPFLLQPDPGTRKWHFDLIFDYGARDTALAATPAYDVPVGTDWPLRPDPVAHYRYGFEVRTLRLCRQVLMFHAFPELGGEPVLVRRTLFEYDAQTTGSQLVAVHDIGYGEAGPEYGPPRDFDYHRFALPAMNQEAPFVPFVPFEPDSPDAGMRFPGLNDGRQYQMVDLFGEGIPGVLSRDESGWWYRRPIRKVQAGSGRDDIAYAPWQSLGQVPTVDLRSPTRQFLTDLTGDGRLDWVVAQPGMAGFFSLDPSQAWGRFTPYAAFPSEFFHPQAQLADLVGAGLSDLVLIGTRSVRLYGNLRADAGEPSHRGFSDPVTVAHAEANALPVLGDGRFEVVAFSDVLGSGQQHLLRVRHDEISCFPNLGRGRFGARIKLADLPFARESFNPAHVRLADLDGSGATDLLYFQGRTVQVFMNQSGHGFAPGVVLTLPKAMSYDAITELSVADLQGLGCSSLVATVQRTALESDDPAGLRPVHWRCDFVDGAKPYLLCRTDNNMGVEGSVEYRSSAQEWLDEKQEYTDPPSAVCRLPFPVHVVARQTQIDQITGNRLTQSFQYRGGYYDGVEREFRGFARLCQTDTESPADGDTPDEGFIAPVQTRTWFHVGAALDPERDGTYAGDPYAQQHPLGPTLRSTTVSATGVDGLVARWDDDAGLHADTERDAGRALAGMSWRSEVWRVAVSPAELPQTPYSVTETRYLLRRLSPRTTSQRHARLLPLVVERRAFNYDEQQGDPRCEHAFGLRWDRHGHAMQSASIVYARRADASPPFVDDGSEDHGHFVRWWNDAHDTAQEHYYLSESLSAAIHLDGGLGPDYWRLHLPCRSRGHAWSLHRTDDAVTPQDLGYEALRGASSLFVTHASKRILTGQALLRYQDCADDAADFKALPAFTESAELDEQALQAYIPPGETVSKLGATPAQIAEKLGDAGYVAIGHWDPVTGASPVPSPPDLWAIQRGFATFAGLSGFYRMTALKPVRGAGESTFEYDTDYCVTRAVTAPDGCKTQVVAVDYRFLAPSRIDDPNQNSQEACYDGLGRVVASTFWGTEAEIGAGGVVGLPKAVGFAHIDRFVRTYTLPDEAIGNPDGALQGVAQAFFHDAFSGMRVDPALVARVPPGLVGEMLWSIQGQTVRFLRAVGRWRLADPARFVGLPDDVRRDLLASPRQPVHSATLYADRYPSDPDRQIRIAVSAYDGFGRVLQAKQKVPDGEAYVVENGVLVLDEQGQPSRDITSTRWRVTERVEYNNKGLAVRVYRPYFANTHEHIRDESFRQFGYCDRYFYDPLGRPLRIVTPREERVEDSPRRSLKRGPRPAAATWIVRWYMKRWTYYPWYVVAEDENDTALEMATT